MCKFPKVSEFPPPPLLHCEYQFAVLQGENCNSKSYEENTSILLFVLFVFNLAKQRLLQYPTNPTKEYFYGNGVVNIHI